LRNSIASLIACSLATASPAVAQRASIQLGVQTGASIASLAGTDTPQGSGSRVSPFIGGTVVYHRTGSAIGWESGLAFVPKGADASLNGSIFTLAISYVELPLMVRFGLPLQGSRVMPVLSVGGTVALRSGCSLRGESGSQSISVGCDDSFFGGAYDLKSVDFGISAGTAVDFPIGNRFVFAPSVRYTRGLAVIGNTPDNADARNSVFLVGATLRMRL
jgi:Outer membrane protein beta-barrel domain